MTGFPNSGGDLGILGAALALSFLMIKQVVDISLKIIRPKATNDLAAIRTCVTSIDKSLAELEVSNKFTHDQISNIFGQVRDINTRLATVEGRLSKD